MKIVFFGTPDYVLPILELLHKEFKSADKETPLACVVTQKPKPTGRKKILTYSPVDCWAYKKGLPKFFSSQEFLNSKIPADIGILASYAEIIPESVINYFKYGILNIHPSLLPKYRGASPIQAALACGDQETGVSIIKMDKLLDHGPIVSQFKEEILSSDTNETLRERLFERASKVLVALLKPYISGKITTQEQDHKKAALTRQIKKEDAFIPAKIVNNAIEGKNPKKEKIEIPFIKGCLEPATASTLNNFIRAMQPWPVSWTLVQLNSNIKNEKTQMRLKIQKAHAEGSKLILDEVQLEGKNPVTWEQFTQGYPNYSLFKA